MQQPAKRMQCDTAILPQPLMQILQKTIFRQATDWEL